MLRPAPIRASDRSDRHPKSSDSLGTKKSWLTGSFKATHGTVALACVAGSVLVAATAPKIHGLKITAIKRSLVMSVAVITYDHVMGRWEPNARGRLAQAALTLYAEQGFEQTTAAEIARHAGLTERTFFRHYADKREVLFYGSDSVRDLLVSAVADAPANATAMDAVSAALQVACAPVQENPELARLRYAVVSANTELRERELVKFGEFAAAIAGALRDRGIPEPTASLAAETGIAVYRVAFARWISEPGQPDLPESLRESMDELGNVLTCRVGQPATSPAGRLVALVERGELGGVCVNRGCTPEALAPEAAGGQAHLHHDG
jgi:AcrR family transcriptional regulator